MNIVNADHYESIKALHTLFFEVCKSREIILRIEEWVKQLPTHFDSCPYAIEQSIVDGLYTRKMTIPAGHIICGKIHTKDYLVTVLEGVIWVTSEYGSRKIYAPCTFTARKGTKHIGFVLKNTTWMDVHRVTADNVQEAEKEIFADSYAQYDKDENIIDYQNMCMEIGLNIETIKKASEINCDLIEQPITEEIEIKSSKIEGMGVFTKQAKAKGEIIALARDGYKRTPAGRYCNHSNKPNCEGIIHGNKGYFRTLDELPKGAEMTVDYRQIIYMAKILDGILSCQAG